MLTYNESKGVGDISTQHTFRVEQRKSSMTLRQSGAAPKGKETLASSRCLLTCTNDNRVIKALA